MLGSRSIRKTRGDLRKFGLTLGIAFGVIAGVTLWRGHDAVALVLAGIGAALLVSGALFPGALRQVERVWMGLALALSKVTTPIFLGILYYLVLTPVGLLRRTVGSHPLRHVAESDSYWARRKGPPSELERQF